VDLFIDSNDVSEYLNHRLSHEEFVDEDSNSSFDLNSEKGGSNIEFGDNYEYYVERASFDCLVELYNHTHTNTVYYALVIVVVITQMK